MVWRTDQWVYCIVKKYTFRFRFSFIHCLLGIVIWYMVTHTCIWLWPVWYIKTCVVINVRYFTQYLAFWTMHDNTMTECMYNLYALQDQEGGGGLDHMITAFEVYKLCFSWIFGHHFLSKIWEQWMIPKMDLIHIQVIFDRAGYNRSQSLGLSTVVYVWKCDG